MGVGCRSANLHPRQYVRGTLSRGVGRAELRYLEEGDEDLGKSLELELGNQSHNVLQDHDVVEPDPHFQRQHGQHHLRVDSP